MVELSNPSLLETLNRSGRAWKARALAELLGMSVPTIYKYVRLGKLPVIRPDGARSIRFDGPTVARALGRSK
jgi:excisionase family DNA binding protein